MLSAVVLALPLVGQQRSAPKAPPTVAEAMEQAKKAAEAEQFGSAITALQEAIRLLRAQQRAAVFAVMPKPEGFAIEDEQVDEHSEAMLAGMAVVGAAATRHYRKDDKSITVEVTTNSPMLGVMAAMFANPMLIKADGGELVQYGAHKAILKEGKDRDTELQILMHDKHLIKVTASGLTGDEVLKVFDQAFVDRMEKPLGK